MNTYKKYLAPIALKSILLLFLLALFPPAVAEADSVYGEKFNHRKGVLHNDFAVDEIF